ncbi:MAG: cytochrome b/b6 domain-containing protein [Frankiaceae bacterium]|nr:cytochrome b/b6 domain-containing protein [Arenimonas sp.]
MSSSPTRSTYRHRLPMRIMHWINVACLTCLFMSGLTIFNAHPALYWGNISTFQSPALSLTAKPGPDGKLRGQTQVGSLTFDTTGVLGVSKNMAGIDTGRGFPKWATIPGPRNLAEGRRWHFFFAWLFVINGLAYWLWSWRARHLRDDLAPTHSDWRGIGQSIRDHLRFKHPTGDQATRYNVLQKLAYLSVIFIFAPGIVLLGLAMSPHLNSVLGWMVDLAGGRQSARTWHFIVAFALLGFVAVHVFMVLVSGPVNQVRAMITGRYRIRDEPPAIEGDDHVGK